MKTGRTLQELAQEVLRQREARKDFVAKTTAMVMHKADKGVMLRVGEHDFGINGIAHDQIGTHTGIPGKYYDRMMAEHPDLLALNVNEWFNRNPTPRLARTLDGRLRAFLSDGYRPLDNWDLCEAVLPTLQDAGLAIMSCEVTETRLYLKAVDQRIERDVPQGRRMGDGTHTLFDTVCPAVIISNSEVGFGSLSVESGVYTRACTNMALFSDEAFKRRHVGSKTRLLEGESVRHMLTDETKRATDKALWLQVRDVVRGALSETKFAKTVDKLKAAAGVAISPQADVVKVVELSGDHFGFNDGERKSVLQHLIKGGDLTKYGLHSAVTRAAQDLDSYDRATEFEGFGAQVIDLPAGDWKRISEAA